MSFDEMGAVCISKDNEGIFLAFRLICLLEDTKKAPIKSALFNLKFF
jgi:hypothetical protein